MQPRTRRAERMRRLRARQRDGVIVAPVEVSPDIVEAIAELGWLPWSVSEDRKAIGDALARMLADMARTRKKA